MNTYADTVTLDWKERAQRVADGIRRRVLKHTILNNGGYLSQACSSAEIFATLYTRVMKLGESSAPLIPVDIPPVYQAANPIHFRGAEYNGPIQPEYDRFFVSPGHYALIVYATLVEIGRLSEEGLARFNKDGSTVEMIGADHSPGFEVMSGSLAQALSVAGGVAHARKIKRESGRVWVFLSDGEMQEGQTWEAIAAMSFYQLDNIGVYVDVNRQQCDGRMEDVMNVEPLVERLTSFGAICEAVDGHDLEALAAPASRLGQGKPLFVLAYTDPCRGIPLLEARRPFLHYVRFKSAEEKNAYEELYTRTYGDLEG